jgi:DNA-binding PadR family transcriptional regulator
VLQALLNAAGGTHGYAIIKATGLHSGAVYPILHRLKAAEWITATSERQGVGAYPPRTYYMLTDQGRTQASEYVTHVAARYGGNV